MTFVIILTVILFLYLTSCASSKPVDYSYTQDSRDSMIARVHHYEVKSEPEKQVPESAFELVIFTLISLIVFLTL